VLFNNAGIFAPKPFLEVTEVEFDRFLDNILKSAFFTAQATAKAMKAAGRGGAIVQTGSMWALQAIGATPSSAYSAAKAGVHALVKNLAIELAPDKIRVNAIAPAVIETPVYDTFLTPEQVKAVLPTFKALHPLGRNGQVADVAEALLFLASDQASFITLETSSSRSGLDNTSYPPLRTTSFQRDPSITFETSMIQAPSDDEAKADIVSLQSGPAKSRSINRIWALTCPIRASASGQVRANDTSQWLRRQRSETTARSRSSASRATTVGLTDFLF